MSVSIDDLVASLSSNHIGQREMDLAALQAQLNKAFMNQQSCSESQDHRKHRSSYCSTPMAVTPTSAAFHNHAIGASRPSVSRHASHNKIRAEDQWSMMMDDDQNDEDERRVESLLSPPHDSFSSYTHPSHDSSTFIQNARPYEGTSQQPTWNDHLSVSSSFANTDPFYLQTLQRINNPASSSHFAQAGLLPHHSPFAMQSATQSRAFAY